MGYSKLKLVLFSSVIVMLSFYFNNDRLEVMGDCVHPELKNLFGQILQSEAGGAAFSVVHKGKVVCDLYGGFKDSNRKVKWQNDTMAISYSTTKVWAGLSFAILKSRGIIDYDSKVSSLWPEFGKNNKTELTIRDVLDHKAGLLTLGDFSVEVATDPLKMDKLIIEAEPSFAPGEQVAYHALTYGFLVDALIRRIAPQYANVKEFLDNELLANGEDYFIGIPLEQHHRVAEVTNPSLMSSIVAHASNPAKFMKIVSTIQEFGPLAETAISHPDFLNVMKEQKLFIRSSNVPYNKPEVQQVPMISAMGIGTASGFAKAISRILSSNYVSNKVWSSLSTPTESVFDIALAEEKNIGHGFYYVKHPIDPKRWNVRFVGNGIQFLEFNQQDQIVITLLRNGLKAGDQGLLEYENLAKEVFKILA